MDKKICYNCFTEHDGQFCPECGYKNLSGADKHPLALPEGTVLAGKYILGRVLGQGGFGITYIAQDYNTKELVAIKEFFPDTMAARTDSTTVSSYSDERADAFIYGKECFLQEAKTLAEFNGNPNIVKIYSYFEENGTAYFAMEYVDGISLLKYLQDHGGKISVKETENVLFPIMDALNEVHAKGIIHRDISPDNIYITKDGQIKLLDFGAARYSLGDRSRSLDVVLKHGYAPKEQYARHGRQGPYTDVYSLAATFYRCITGRIPPDSIDRIDEDDLMNPSSLGVDISPAKEDALLRGLAINPSDRYMSMNDFKMAMLNPANAPAPVPFNTSFTQTSSAPVTSTQQTFSQAALVTSSQQTVSQAAPVTSAQQVPAEKKPSGFVQFFKKLPKWVIPAAAGAVLVIAAGIVVSVILLNSNPAKNFKFDAESSEGVVIEKYIGEDNKADIPAEIQGKSVDTVKEYAFSYSKLNEIVIPNTVKTIEKQAFYKAKIKSFNIPDSVTEIGDSAFRGSSLESITIPGSVKNISSNAFSDCENLKTVKLENGVESIGDSAFSGCSALEEIEMPETLKTIEGSVFGKDTSLTSITIPESVSSLGERVFSECTKLKEVKLPEALKTIGASMFYNCMSIEKLSIPNNVSSITSGAFTGCTSLKEINTFGKVKDNASGSKLDSYNISGLSNLEKFTVPKNIKTLSSYSLSSDSLKTLVIPDGVKTIEKYAANYNKKLSSVKIAGSVKTIGDGAFEYCDKLSSVKLSKGVRKIGSFAFAGDKKLKKITIPSSVFKVYPDAFYKCTKLSKVKFQKGVKKFSKYMFYDCKSLKKVSIPGSVKKIAASAFYGCKNLKKVKICKGVKEIGRYAFLSCKKLKKLSIAKSVRRINSSAFGLCKKLKKVTVSKKCKIHKYAFHYKVKIKRKK